MQSFWEVHDTGVMATVSDVVRAALLFRFGGFYLDTDVISRVPILPPKNLGWKAPLLVQNV